MGRQAGLHGTPYSVFRDREGSLWIGMLGQGLVRWAGYRQWEAYTTNSGLTSDVVFQVLARSDGTVWAGTESGLFHGVRRGQGYVWRKITAIGDMPIISMAFDSGGKLWIGTEERGIERLDPATNAVERVGRAQGLDSTSVVGLLIDRQRPDVGGDRQRLV